MIDTHMQRSAPGRIPFLSPILHCIAMTALVYLRSSFGFVFLRPKSVFFAVSWAFSLFVIVAWNEPGIWREYRAVCVFGVGSIVLYWIHLLITFGREMYRSGKHDHFSGFSHPLFLMRRFGAPLDSAEKTLHLWAEPALVLSFSVGLRFAFAERHLSTWLAIVAACMFGKETMNYWAALRRDKILDDSLLDAKRRGDVLPDKPADREVPKATRKDPVKLKRNTASADDTARERKFAELLRVRSPYALDTAEENYRALVRLEHPDTNENTPEKNARTAELNEAINFFRERLKNQPARENDAGIRRGR